MVSPDTSSATDLIVSALTRAIVAHRLVPGRKLSEQKLAGQFGVLRTLVRQAFFQLSQNRLIHMEPARGAFVATPSIAEAREVFDVHLMDQHLQQVEASLTLDREPAHHNTATRHNLATELA